MATLRLRSLAPHEEPVDLKVPEVDDDRLADMLGKIDASLVERGGIWVHLNVGDRGAIRWFPAMFLSVHASFDGPVPPAARAMTPQHETPLAQVIDLRPED